MTTHPSKNGRHQGTMLIQIDSKTEIDTDRDLSPGERHVLQKLFGWKAMVYSVKEFRQKKKKALVEGWNNSGPIRETKPLSLVAKKFEKEIKIRLQEQKKL